MVTATSRRPSLSGTTCVWTSNWFHLSGIFPPQREIPEFDVKPHLLAPLLILSQCYLVKSFLPGRTSARQLRFEFRHYLLIDAKDNRTSPACLPAIPLATRSHQVVFAYNQVNRPHGSYHPSGALSTGKHKTHHRLICLQLSSD